MNSVTALMLSRAIEEDRRREIERRPHRLMTPERMSAQRVTARGRWTFRAARLDLAASKA